MGIPQVVRILARPLCLGSNGQEVRALQSFLNGSGVGPKVTVDGRFGKTTQDALEKFQLKQGLKPDGVVGPKTAEALGWQYRAGNALAYIVSYDAPPLPAMTPPLEVVVEVIRNGMDTFKELLADRIRSAYARTNYGVVTPDDISKEQFRQVRLRLEDLEHDYHKLMMSLLNMEDISGNDGLVIGGVREAFANFVSDMHSGLKAMEFYSGATGVSHEALDRLPYEQALSKVEHLLRGDVSAIAAVGQIQIAFNASNGVFEASPPG